MNLQGPEEKTPRSRHAYETLCEITEEYETAACDDVQHPHRGQFHESFHELARTWAAPSSGRQGTARQDTAASRESTGVAAR